MVVYISYNFSVWHQISMFLHLGCCILTTGMISRKDFSICFAFIRLYYKLKRNVLTTCNNTILEFVKLYFAWEAQYIHDIFNILLDTRCISITELSGWTWGITTILFTGMYHWRIDWLIEWGLTPLSAVFQLYRGGLKDWKLAQINIS